jgi:hypothetical protein
MNVTEHNISEWRLNESEINELIKLAKEKMKQCDEDKQCELFYGLITGKLIIMKNTADETE